MQKLSLSTLEPGYNQKVHVLQLVSLHTTARESVRHKERSHVEKLRPDTDK